MVVAGASVTGAQTLGTFRWQQQPYCNVVSLTVVQEGAFYRINGFDDQCGAATLAAASGLALPNPNGSIGFGLTIVTTPGGTPLHLDATISLSTLSGTWRDSAGGTGAWVFTPGAPTPGAPRPVPRITFPGGLSASGATVTNVGAPSSNTDAANKSYVDTSAAADRAYARSVRTLPVLIHAYAGLVQGIAAPDFWGCVSFDTAASSSLRLDIPLPNGATMTALTVRYFDTSAASMSIIPRVVTFAEGSAIDGVQNLLTSTNGSGGARVETITFSPVPPAVNATRSYYLHVTSPAHTGVLAFCGAAAIYTLP